jgi:hypothetical protein
MRAKKRRMAFAKRVCGPDKGQGLFNCLSFALNNGTLRKRLTDSFFPSDQMPLGRCTKLIQIQMKEVRSPSSSPLREQMIMRKWVTWQKMRTRGRTEQVKFHFHQRRRGLDIMSLQSSFAWPFICTSQTALKACDDESTFFWLFHRKRPREGNKKQARGGARGKETCRVGDDDSRCLQALGCESLTWLVTLQMHSAPWKWLHKHIASEKWVRHFYTWKSRRKVNGLPTRRGKSEFRCIWIRFH